MAVYGKNKEKWYPRKQSKVKVSKNRTVEWAKTADGALLKDFLWLHVASDGATGTIRDIGGGFALNAAPTVVTGVLSVIGSSTNLITSPVTTARFNPAGTGFSHNTTQQCLSSNINFTEQHFWTKTGAYKYISLWVKIDQQHAGSGNDGHTILAIGRSQDTAHSVPHTFDPWMSLSTNSSRNIELRFSNANSGSGTGDETTDYDYDVGGDVSTISYMSDQSLTDSKWHHVLFSFDGSSTCKVYIDGILAGSPAGVGTYTLANRISTAPSSIRLGNKCGGYSTIDTTPKTLSGDAGFDGSIAEFSIFTLEQSPDNVARIVYEASREGVHALHSGIHNSSPRLEQLDLDRDSLYPSNFTLENYTMGGYQAPVSRISSRSESKFTEGYNTADAGYKWQENASQYFINSNKVMPHLRVNPADTILTNGNWYDDSRSEFFPEDLDQTTGFVITDQSSDEIYREHHTEDTSQKFVDLQVHEDFKDCFVIEIPIPNTAALLLGTDRQSVHSSSAETARINNASGNVTANPGARIANMAYYNFSTNQWEDLNHGPYTTDHDYGLYAAAPTDTNFIDQNDIGFSPMSGIIVPTSERIAEKVLPVYGLPTSDFGFPIAQQFAPAGGQTIDLSKYIDEPVILEGWEVKTKVIPVVGYAGYNDNASQDTAFGYSGIGSGKSPFHYGAHGDAAVFFNLNKNVTAFDENIYTDGSSNEFHMGTTVPVTNGSTGVELQPANDAKGLVTSGITTFLLKKEKVTDTDSLAETFFLTKDKKKISKLTDLTDNPNFQSPWQTLAATNDEVSHETTYSQHAGGSSVPFIATDKSAFANSNNTSVVGWLQHVYHNDQYLKTFPTRSFWTRTNDPMNQYRYTQGKNIIGMLNKENTTYISNLLYDNTTAVDFQVQGKLKTVGQKDDGIPISNFFIKPASGASMGIRVTDQSADISKKYAISTTSETSISFGDSGLADHAIVPRYGSGNSIGKTKMPRINFPSKRSGSDSVVQFHKDVKLFDSLVDTSTTILNPTDELILGIQNSISTAYASQQIKGNTDDFIRWGRTSLTIPAQTAADSTSFLRLFVKKTRSDEDFNIVADSSRYNTNVNRDLGDHANADQHVVSNSIIYSGSMADDIVGPTFFVGPFLGFTVPVFAAGNSIDATKTGGFTSNIAILSDGERHGKTGVRQFWHYYYTSWSDAAFTNLPWNSLSASAFLQRGQNANPRFPAVGWTDSTNYDKKGAPNNLEYTGGYSINEWLELVQWVIIEPDPGAPAGPGAGGSWVESDAQSAGLNPISEPLKQPYTDTLAYSSALPFRDRPFCKLSEINTNNGNAATGHVIHRHRTSANYFQIDQSKSGENCPGISAWSMNITVPIFLDVGVQLTPYLTAFTCDFRLVAIPKGISGSSYGVHPTYHDGTQIALGDAFYFNRLQQAIKIRNATDLTAARSGGSLVDNDYWSRQWYHADARNNKAGPMIYIVGGEINIHNRNISSTSTHAYKTWEDVNAIIADVLNGQQIIEDSLLYTIETNTADGSFKVLFPQDPFLRQTLETFENDLHTSSAFRLCGINMNQNTDHVDYPENLVSNTVRLYWDNTADSDSVVDHTMIWFGGDLGYSNSFSLSNTAAENLPYQNVLLGTAPATLTTNYTQETNGSGNFLKNYLTPLKSIVKSAKAVALSEISGTAGDLYPSRPNIDNITIDFSNFPSDGSGPKFSIVKEIYNEEVGRRIDRSVQRRASSHATVDNIKEAGPFGSLRNMLCLQAQTAIYDSMIPASLLNLDMGYCGIYTHGTKVACEAAGETWNETDYITTLSDIPQNFPYESNEAKIFEIKPKGIKVKMYTTGADTGATAQNTDTIVISNELANSAGNYSWEVNTISANSFDEGGKGLLNISNYIQEDFKGNLDFTEKTIRDYTLGFGNGPSGKMVIRPDIYPYKAWTSGTNSSFAVQWILDPPRGARFGLYNVVQSMPKYLFSYRHFGHMRDMLEQSLDTKFINHASNERVFGAPVVVNAINITNPEVPKQMANTSRYNKTINATVTKPYIEDNYEAIQQPVNLESETLRVDVAGAIRSNRVLAPGSISSNIRSR